MTVARVDYSAYIDSDAWREFRRRALDFYGNVCAKCGRNGDDVVLQVHHLTYRRLGHEEMEDVTVLCIPHHKEADEKRKRKRGKR